MGYDNIIQLHSLFHVTKGRLRLYFYAGKIAHVSLTYNKVNKTHSLQPSCCNGPLVSISSFRCVCLSVCLCDTAVLRSQVINLGK